MGEVTWRQPPPPVAPGRKGVAFGPHIGNGVYAMAAPGMAAAEPRQREPTAFPRSVFVDRLLRIVRAGRQVTAIDPEQGRDRPTIGGDGAEERRFRDVSDQVHG